MAERLHFAEDAMPYASMLAAEHLSRYALVKSLCVGRRVLDIACGEGYGSALMRAWGAKEVCGLDISSQAISNAQRMFGDSGIQFLAGDASACGSLFQEWGAFDLIVSFETLEHVADVRGMLKGFGQLLTASGAIVISCPNDAAVLTTGPNHFHIRTYTFDEFRDTVTAVLGEASSWAVGTSVIGFGAFSHASKLLDSPPRDISGLMSNSEADTCALLPAQVGHEVDDSNCAYYVAGWNCMLPQTSVVAPISFRAYEGPWNNWLHAKAEAERLEAMLEDTDCRQAQEFKQLRIASNLAAAHWRQNNEAVTEEARTVQASLNRRLDSLSLLNEETLRRAHDLRITLDITAAHWQQKNEEVIEEARTVQASLNQRLDSLSRLNEETVLRAHDFENMHRQSLLTVERLERLERSRWHQAGKFYYRLYEVPALGALLRASRRLSGALWRLLHKL